MNKIDSHPPTLIHPENIASQRDHVSSPRLIVLISTDADYTSATRRISELANTSGAHVLFLGLCRDATQELSLRRELVTLSTLFLNAGVPAETQVEIATNWITSVKRNYRAGDIILCFAGQGAGLLRRPLHEVLQADLNAPIYILSDLTPQNLSQSNRFSQIMVWLGSAGIIIGFFLLQIRITSYPQDWAQTTLMILSVIGEAWLIWVWNTLFS